MKAGLLDSVRSPADLRAIPRKDLPRLAEEIRERIITVTSRNGGHIGPNLGVVELTIALHRIFDCPADRFVFDVSHQGYVHKLLTGRNDEAFDLIRLGGGYSGFLNRGENEADCFGAGHAGTALSAALGMATARDLRGGEEHVVAICGDAAFTCGVTLEALNNVRDATKRLVIILNDNEWSIDKNVGAIARTLNDLITNPIYNRMSADLESFLKRVPGGESILRLGSKWKRETKDFFMSSSIFENFGIRYIGPIDGHNLDDLEQYLEFARNSPEPLVLHVITKKGKGCEAALQHPEKFHGTSPFDPETGESLPGKPGTPPKFQDAFGAILLAMARRDRRIVGITGAMPSGTGLSMLRDELPDQYFDVGIAEEHAVLFAAGMATNGLRPVCAIYSTFLQRAYDMIVHDVCLQNLPVTFCMDRAGLSPNDGPTHHGLFDIAYLRCVPRAVVMQPRDEVELGRMMATALAHEGPAFLRYPRGSGSGRTMPEEFEPLPIGRAEALEGEAAAIQFWALGPWVGDALDMAALLREETGLEIGVVDARFAKPIDRDLLRQQHRNGLDLLVTFEDHVLRGGFGSAVLEELNDLDIRVPVHRFAWPDRFVDHGSSVEELREANGLGREQILRQLRALVLKGSPRSTIPYGGPVI